MPRSSRRLWLTDVIEDGVQLLESVIRQIEDSTDIGVMQEKRRIREEQQEEEGLWQQVSRSYGSS